MNLKRSEMLNFSFGVDVRKYTFEVFEISTFYWGSFFLFPRSVLLSFDNSGDSRKLCLMQRIYRTKIKK